MAETEQEVSKTHRYPCPGCAGDLAFEPKEGALACPYCGRVEQIPQSAEQVVERSYEEYLRVPSERLEKLADNALEVECKGCGATVSFTPPEVVAECGFCGRQIVGQPKVADPLVAPEGVLPFYISSEQATDSIKKWLASRWFAPNALKRLAYQEAISGTYLPYWTYDSHTTTHYTGKRGEYYYETQTYTETDSQGRTVTKTRQVRRTRWYPASGVVSRWFDDVLVPASRNVPSRRLTALEPWDLHSLVSFQPAYLAGHRAQRYQVGLAEGFEEAKSIMAPTIQRDIRHDIGGDEQIIDNTTTSYSGISFKHILLPVYIGAYRFSQKSYQVMVNARTGQVHGERPYSVWKIIFFIAFLLAVLLSVVYFSG